MNDRELFEQYKKELGYMADNLSLKRALSSDRKGLSKIRDSFVFFKTSWAESLAYISIIQTVIIFSALIPQSIGNINGFFSFLHIPLVLPKEAGSIIALIGLVVILVFGVITFRYFGLTRRASELSCLYNAGTFLYYKKFNEIKDRLERLEDKVEDK